MCPRCKQNETNEDYGPCDTCIAEIRETAACQNGWRNLMVTLTGKGWPKPKRYGL